MSFPRYPEYKDSGVEWLGEVPGHWALKPLWTHFRRVKRTGFEAEQLLSVYRDYGVITKASRDDNFNKPSDDLSVYQLVVPGDLAINKMKAWQGSVAISDHRGIVSPAYFVYEALHKADGRFLHYLMRSMRYITGYLSVSKGIRVNQWDLEPQLHSRMPLVVPPIPEQTQIAAFLDRETAKIDALVAVQRRLMALLKEKRQAVISHAVTRGLNPDAPMKPSGIEWLGEVPGHWEIGSVKRFFASHNPRRIPLSGEERSGRNGDFPYYGASGIIDNIDDFIFDEDMVLVSEDGANLVNRSTPIAFVATGKYWVNNHAHILKPLDQNLVFWAERLEMIDLAPFITGSAQPKLTSEALNSLMISVPKTSTERLAIQNYILNETAKFDTLTTEAQRAIDLLQERRTALISAAVTGQIDVRGVAQIL